MVLRTIRHLHSGSGLILIINTDHAAGEISRQSDLLASDLSLISLGANLNDVGVVDILVIGDRIDNGGSHDRLVGQSSLAVNNLQDLEVLTLQLVGLRCDLNLSTQLSSHQRHRQNRQFAREVYALGSIETSQEHALSVGFINGLAGKFDLGAFDAGAGKVNQTSLQIDLGNTAHLVNDIVVRVEHSFHHPFHIFGEIISSPPSNSIPFC